LVENGLVHFTAQAIKFISSSLGENSARSEVLLTHFHWDAAMLKKEYMANPEKVLTACMLKPKPESNSSQG
jgi:hypothetical protein